MLIEEMMQSGLLPPVAPIDGERLTCRSTLMCDSAKTQCGVESY